MAVTAGNRMWDSTMKPCLSESLVRLRPTLQELEDLGMIYHSIKQVLLKTQDKRFITEAEVDYRLGLIERWLAEKKDNAPSLRKRSLDEELASVVANVKRSRSEWTEQERPIKDKMVLGPEDASRLDASASALPDWTDRVDSTPKDLIPSPLEIESLKHDQEWLYDTILSPYLLLVCHTANGHFSGQTLPVAPKWHVWSPNTHQLVDQPNERNNLWPPRHYPNARIADVEVHLFPMCLRSHWVMVVLSKVGGEWAAKLISSMHGYRDVVEEEWVKIAEWLYVFHGMPEVSMTYSPEQLLQNNSNDCGVFVLCEARWALEGWSRESIQPARISDFRRCMTLELFDWRLRWWGKPIEVFRLR